MNLYLLRCLHLAMSSDLLFNVVSGSAHKIANFSAKHIWRCIAPLLYGLALQTMDHFMTGGPSRTAAALCTANRAWQKNCSKVFIQLLAIQMWLFCERSLVHPKILIYETLQLGGELCGAFQRGNDFALGKATLDPNNATKKTFYTAA